MAKKTAAKKKTSRKTTAKATTSRSTAPAPKKTGTSYVFSCELCGRERVAETESMVCDGTEVSVTSDGQIVVTDVNRHSPETMNRRN